MKELVIVRCCCVAAAASTPPPIGETSRFDDDEDLDETTLNGPPPPPPPATLAVVQPCGEMFDWDWVKITSSLPLLGEMRALRGLAGGPGPPLGEEMAPLHVEPLEKMAAAAPVEAGKFRSSETFGTIPEFIMSLRIKN